MELVIPLQTFDPSKVHIDITQVTAKSIITFSYKDTTVALDNINLLLPYTKIISYQSATGKLILDMKEHGALQQRFRQFQDTIQKYVAANYKKWFPYITLTAEQLDTQFQKCVNQNVILLYCPSGAEGAADAPGKPVIPVCRGGAWFSSIQPNDLAAGSHARVSIRLTSIAFHMDSENKWTGKYRLQHKIQAVYLPSPPSAESK